MYANFQTNRFAIFFSLFFFIQSHNLSVTVSVASVDAVGISLTVYLRAKHFDYRHYTCKVEAGKLAMIVSSKSDSVKSD